MSLAVSLAKKQGQVVATQPLRASGFSSQNLTPESY